MGWIDAELVLVALAAMLSPTTLSFCVLSLVLGERPLRTGLCFYVGALTATLAVGVAAALVLGDAAASPDQSTPKTWVAIVDVVAAALLVAFVVRTLRRPADPARTAAMITRMSKVASSPAIAIVGAGAILANPGGFIPIALKTISETDPSATGYVVDWVFFAVASLLPLAAALVMLAVARGPTERVLESARAWLERRARTVAAVILLALAAALLRNGIAGLTG
jgi:Sap, sulfolipid-1-addressing protein